MSMDNADKFCSLFSNFCLVVRPKKEARHKATKEDIQEQVDYKTKSQIKNMLKKATEEYNHAKKMFKHGKISKEELYDYEWRVFELKEELDKFNDKGVA
jgi:hypothetical protein